MHVRADINASRRLETLGQMAPGFPYSEGMPGSEPSVAKMVSPAQRRLKATGKLTRTEVAHMPVSAPMGFIGPLVDIGRNLLTSGGRPPANVARPPGVPLPGTEPSVPRQPASITTVSPTIQTQVSPQISPTMVQQQDSPGATVGASPSQFMPGGQAAETGMSPYGSWGAPGMPGTTAGVSPMQPYTMTPDGRYVPLGPNPGQYSRIPMPAPVQQAGGGMPWVPLVIVGGAAALAFALTGKRRRGS